MVQGSAEHLRALVLSALLSASGVGAAKNPPSLTKQITRMVPPELPRSGQILLENAATSKYSLVPGRLTEGAILGMWRSTQASTPTQWVLDADGTLRSAANNSLALTVNLTKEANELTYKVYLSAVGGADTDTQRWIYHADKTLRLKRYPDCVLGVNWWTRVADGVEVSYFDAGSGLHHKANRQWTWDTSAPSASLSLLSISPHAKAFVTSFVVCVAAGGLLALLALLAHRCICLLSRRSRVPYAPLLAPSDVSAPSDVGS
mmetsp:Transcript_32999/g.70544  ORF Transcript_32999/g.70544 Transcript_32999/m.70544 type:complete len:261 (-) Transcript_32999:372-1154(-)